MLSAAATKFAASGGTAADFQAFWQEAPKEAAQFTVRLGDTMGLHLDGLEKARAVAAGTVDGAAFVGSPDFQQVTNAYAIASLADLRAGTLGWTTGSPVKAPLVVGICRVNGNALSLETGRGTFELDTPAFGDSQNYLEASLLQTFANRAVSVRGWPCSGGASGAPKIAVEQFAPGFGRDFASGRLGTRTLPDGTSKIGINVYPGQGLDGWIEIKDPELARRLAGLSRLGVILPGKVSEENGHQVFTFEGPVDQLDYYMLSKAFPPNQLQMAHGTMHPVSQGAEFLKAATARHLVFGHIDADANSVVVKDLKDTSMYTGARGTGTPDWSTAGAAKLCPLEDMAFAPGQDSFAPDVAPLPPAPAPAGAALPPPNTPPLPGMPAPVGAMPGGNGMNGPA
ncbi:MAG: hypothetical protein K1X89_27270 [Myxococcaceae bacterium]|nr:hypothetical protein [Myxococcaceae bacterium]